MTYKQLSKQDKKKVVAFLRVDKSGALRVDLDKLMRKKINDLRTTKSQSQKAG